MKNKFSNGRLSYFFAPRIHGNVLAWVKPASASERNKRAIESILRWADDGGQMIDIGNAAEKIMALSENVGTYSKPVQLNLDKL
jgi:hypothetical protein